MLARGAFLAAALLCGGACSKKAPELPEPPRQDVAISVTDAEKNIVAWNGLTVSVRGWLTIPCEGDSCAILPVQMKAGQRWPEGAALSIASETLVEPAINANQGREVILMGVLSAQCHRPPDLCTDRSPDITPVSLTVLNPATKDH